LKKSPVHFIGNVEGGDLFSGNVDVIVSDGFVGNIALKICERPGVSDFWFTEKVAGHFHLYASGAMLSKGAFKALRKTIDYTEYGARRCWRPRRLRDWARRSNANAVKNAIRVAAGLAARA